MQIGDVVYLKSGSPSMTVIKNVEDGWLVNWINGTILYSGVFPEVCLVGSNPEPVITKETEALRESLKEVVEVKAV